ncbi:MAG: DNA translocase FtsK [Rikenellaceae bacterium]
MSKEKNINENVEHSSGDQIRFIIGVVVVLIGLYATIVSISYLFNWKVDFDMLTNPNSESRPDIEPSYGNIGGRFGAWIGSILIGHSFGLVGIIIPVYLLILGRNILKKSKNLILNRDTLTLFIALILSSLTLGAIFGTKWDLFGRGMGGDFGVHMSNLISGSIAGVGLFLLLAGAWIAFGVFINSNFINVMNKAGDTAVSKTSKLLSCLKKGRKESEETPKVQDEVCNAISLDTNNLEGATIEDLGNIDELYEAEYQPEDTLIKEDEFIATEPEPELEQVQAQEQEVGYPDDDNPFIEIIGPKSTPADYSANQSCDTSTGDVVADPVSCDPEGAIVFVEVNKAKEVDESDIETSLYDPTRDINNFVKPPVTLLEDYNSGAGITDAEIFENKSQIEATLSHFGIPIQQHIKATVGPTITLYEIIQANGVKISKIQGLENDIAQNLKASGIRIIAPIPGAGTIGIELPNRRKQIVSMRSAILSQEFQELKAQLPIVIGRTIQNDNYVFDLAKMPHLLVAGATGQGKSVGLNAIITSLLYRKHPSELKFVMIDPKMVEFSPYKKLEKHYMAKMQSEEEVIITDPKKAVYTLNAICEEMENRLRLLSQAGVRNIVEYNEKFKRKVLLPDKGHFFMPYIVVIIDEFADLIMTAKEVEMPVMRIAQKARAVGIHLIVATQRPDVKVITGGIKANFPARIAFKVTQMIDSRTIIDQPGANQLIGRGDMLFSKDGELTRIQCALVETDEVARIVDHISAQQGYSEAYRLPDYAPDGGSGDFDMGGDSAPVIKYDALFAEIARAAVSNGGISTSAIQRNFEVGFNRAGRIMTQLERSGIVGAQEGSKPRDILFYDMPSLEAKLQELGLF